jgi:nucleoid-associated protein YgaU
LLQKRLEEMHLKIIDETEKSEIEIELEEEAAERYKEIKAIKAKDQWFTVYVVNKGDTLWTIAERKDIYGHPHTWPLIYKYNLVWLRDPDELEPGQILILKTYPTDEELEDALSKAKGRGPWEIRKGHIRKWVSDWLK